MPAGNTAAVFTALSSILCRSERGHKTSRCVKEEIGMSLIALIGSVMDVICQRSSVSAQHLSKAGFLVGLLVIPASAPSPTPLLHPVPCRFAFKACLFLSRLPERPFPSPLSFSPIYLCPGGGSGNWKQVRVCGEERKKRECKVYLCLLSESLPSLFIHSLCGPVFGRNGALCGCFRTVQEQTFSSHVCLWNGHSVCHTGKMEYPALSWHSFLSHRAYPCSGNPQFFFSLIFNFSTYL